jgi:putative restriction endonuclease
MHSTVASNREIAGLPAFRHHVATMRGFVGVTDFDWYRFLRDRDLDEVNFWQPSGRRAFRAIDPGQPFFFKLHAPHNAIAGFGLFARHSVLPDWLAWEAFETKNGASDYATMRQRIEKYRRVAQPSPRTPYDIGCLMIAEPVFFAQDEWIDQPRDWKPNIVQGKGYDLTAGEGRRIWEACLDRARAARPELLVAEGAPRFGEPQLVRPRLGQGTFRVAVTEAYERTCAVTTEHSLPVLEAAHIRAYADGGEHTVSNGLLLRTDVHRLFDRGYVTVTPDLRFEVSRELEREWHNGRIYYALHGREVHVPRHVDSRPDPKVLAWHNETRFRG